MAEIDWAILCDYAFQDVGRKACLIGVFDRVFANAVPAQHHHAAVVIRFRGQPQEKVKFTINIVRPVESGSGTMGTANAEAQLGDSGAVEFITNWAGLPLPDWGTYSFEIRIDGIPEPKIITFTVQKPPAPATPAGKG